MLLTSHSFPANILRSQHLFARPIPSMEPSFDIEGRSRDTSGRSPIQSDATTTMVAVPVDVKERICKIVSLLSQALVLALTLLKAMVSTRHVPIDNHTESLIEGGRRGLPEHDLLNLPEPGGSLVEQEREAVVNRHR